MDEVLRLKADLLAKNYMTIKKKFGFETNLVNFFGAMVHTTEGIKVDIKLLSDVRKYLMNETTWVSQFRDMNLHILSNLLCLEDNYQQLVAGLLELYEKLGKAGFKYSKQLPISAFIIAKSAAPDDWDNSVERMKDIYNRMKENHYFITSIDDYVYAAIYATIDISTYRSSKEIEKCYNIFKNASLCEDNYLQTLSHIVALGEEDIALKCRKTIKIYNDLRDREYDLDDHGLASVGVLALIANDTDRIVDEVAETCDYLHNKGGYTLRMMDTPTKSILAASLVADYYLDNAEKDILHMSLANSIAAIVVAQKIAMISAAND